MSANPYVPLIAAAVPPVLTLLIGGAKAFLGSAGRRRKKMLANMELIERLRGYEDQEGITFAPDVLARAHADLARNTRLYTDRNSWKWIIASSLVYIGFFLVYGYLELFLQELLVHFGLLSSEALVGWTVALRLLGVLLFLWVLVVLLSILLMDTSRSNKEAFGGREHHLVPPSGSELVLPTGSEWVFLKKRKGKDKKKGKDKGRHSRKGAGSNNDS